MSLSQDNHLSDIPWSYLYLGRISAKNLRKASSMPDPGPREFSFQNGTRFPLIRIENNQRNGYWNEELRWKFPPAQIKPWSTFRAPLREKETPGIIAVVAYKFDFSAVVYHQAIPEHIVTLTLNSAEDGDGPNILKASLHCADPNCDPFQLVSLDCETGRYAPGSILPVTVALRLPKDKGTAQRINIERISLAEPSSSPFPVINEMGLSPHFRTSNQLLWSATSGTTPASVSLTSGKIAHLDVAIRAHPWAHLLMEEVRGECKFGNNTVVLQGKAFPAVKAEGIDLVTYRISMELPVPDIYASISPWGLSKDITWKMTVALTRTGGTVLKPQPTPIELYAVSPWLHPSLVREGIPVQLLRFALLPILDLPQFPTDFVDYITTRIHKDTGFIYDTYHGSASYMNSDGHFNLHLWLRDYNILHVGASEIAKYHDYKQFPPTVNCYDQAGILAICVGLGFPDELSSKQLFRAFMDPYGYIQSTHLVGWPDYETNSPFFNAQKYAASIEPADNESRTHFGNHMFVLYRNKVLDACAGPHRGNETLPEYIKNAIDLHHNAKTYHNKNLILRPDGSTGDVKIRSVLADHAMDPIQRVTHIYQHFLIGKTAKADKKHFYIPLDKLTDYLEAHLPSSAFTRASGAFKTISNMDSAIVPASNGVRYGGLITYSMSYVFDGRAYPVDIDWHVCLSSKDALKTLARVSSNSTAHTNGFKEQVFNGQSFYSTPRSEDLLARTIFSYGPHAIVLDSPIGTSGLIPIAQSVLVFIKSNEGNDTTNSAFLSQEEDLDKAPHEFFKLKQGEVFTWNTKVLNFMECDWEYDVGNIFLLDHKLSKTDTSQFTFYGRSQGYDSVKITFTDRFMQQVTRKVVFEVD